MTVAVTSPALGKTPMSKGAVGGPIFIGGPDRCGKTTLQAFLVSHPNIWISAVGSNMWTYFYDRYGYLGKPANFERCLRAMLHYKHVKFLQPDADRIRRDFACGEATYARLFALFQQHCAERAGKPRWGDQTGLVERYAGQILAAYPGAKILHMVRDPRDRYEASISLWPKGKGRAGGATARWLYSVRLAKRNLQRFPDSYMIVQFEKLIGETEKTLRRVCEFLEEEFTPAMLTMEGAPAFRDALEKNAKGATRHSPLSTDFIGGFRSKINKRELHFMQLYAGREMQEFGYQLEPIRFSAGDWLFFSLFDFPANLARKLAWRGVEAAQQAFPRLVPRPISSGKVVRA